MSEIIASEISDWNGLRFQWVMTDEGRKAVRASEVVKALGKPERDTARLVMQHVFPDYRFQSSFGKANRPSWYLYEQGAVQLATVVKSPESEPFQRYIFEVVVKLFAEGGIVLPTATQQQLDKLQADIEFYKSQERREFISGIQEATKQNRSLQNSLKHALQGDRFGLMDEFYLAQGDYVNQINRLKAEMLRLCNWLNFGFGRTDKEIEAIKSGKKSYKMTLEASERWRQQMRKESLSETLSQDENEE